MWNKTPFSRRVGIDHPIVQGPFGGGPSSVGLLCAVSNAGGMGSFGMHVLEPAEMIAVTGEIRKATDKPFALNLWISDGDEKASSDPKLVQATQDMVSPYFHQLGLRVPQAPKAYLPDLQLQLEAILELRPPVFSFVYGVPSPHYLEQCRSRGILTMGTATTPQEAKVLEDAGVDCIVASGPEAGGHRGSFLRPPEESLIGTFALLPQVADTVKTPFIAAGGIADARGIAAAFALGAHGVQIGSAFLACDESAANPLHRASLHGPDSGNTTLTRAFTGRLARSIRNRLCEDLDRREQDISPYPMQSWFVGQLRAAALAQGRDDLVSLSAGQAAPLIRHRQAKALMEELVRETPRLLSKLQGHL